MSIENAVKHIVAEVRQSKRAALTVTREVYPELRLSMAERDSLAVDQLAERARSILTHGARDADGPELESVSVDVTHTVPICHEISVDVQILHSTVFHIAGVPKALVDFTRYDLACVVRDYDAQAEGLRRRSGVLKYAHARLEQLGKEKISELAIGEQSILARRWESAADAEKAEAAAD